MIVANSLTRVFGQGENAVQALSDVSLHIGENEFVAIMGSSGSGKSTLMNILGCLDTPSNGSYQLGQHQVSELDDVSLSAIRNRHIGFIFQSFHLLPRLTALQNVALPLRYSGITPQQALHKASALLDQVGLSHRKDHKPHQMSGGQRQRVAIARALVNNPKVIFADEPTGSLDAVSGERVMSLFFELQARHRTTVLVVTHDATLAARCSRRIQMLAGRIV